MEKPMRTLITAVAILAMFSLLTFAATSGAVAVDHMLTGAITAALHNIPSAR
jgi:CBS-domain-containing membrane protein